MMAARNGPSVAIMIQVAASGLQKRKIERCVCCGGKALSSAYRLTAIPSTSKRALLRRLPDPTKARVGNSRVKYVR